MAEIQPVILCGGAGTRLWPASRSMYPKQLLPLAGGAQTMLQETAQRLKGMDGIARDCLVICNEAHRFLVAQQLQEIGTPEARAALASEPGDEEPPEAEETAR